MTNFEIAVASPSFAYSRFRSWRADGWVKDASDLTAYVYHNDRKSPSGVVLAATLGDIATARDVLARYKRDV